MNRGQVGVELNRLYIVMMQAKGDLLNAMRKREPDPQKIKELRAKFQAHQKTYKLAQEGVASSGE